jgi:CDP-diacylglycerol--serine O-phosphatidyltransferase
MLIPNLITVLAICAGLTGIRLAFENRFELAVAMVLIAAFLDGIDGRVARLLKAQSKFGAQMDSLADIVNFGVAPALVLYVFILDQARSFGWIAAIVYAIAAALRLARFNVISESGVKTAWENYYFVGVPAPAGAMLVLLPIYFGFLGMPIDRSTGFLRRRLHDVHRLPAGQPRPGLFRQGRRRAGAARSGHAVHSGCGGLCLVADEFHLGNADADGDWLSDLPALRRQGMVEAIRACLAFIRCGKDRGGRADGSRSRRGQWRTTTRLILRHRSPLDGRFSRRSLQSAPATCAMGADPFVGNLLRGHVVRLAGPQDRNLRYVDDFPGHHQIGCAEAFRE